MVGAGKDPERSSAMRGNKNAAGPRTGSGRYANKSKPTTVKVKRTISNSTAIAVRKPAGIGKTLGKLAVAGAAGAAAGYAAKKTADKIKSTKK